MMRKIAPLLCLLTLVDAAFAQGSLRPNLAVRLSDGPLVTPALRHKIYSKMAFFGDGAPTMFVPAQSPTVMPGLTVAIDCPAPRPCYLEALIEAQVANAEGIMGFDLAIDGNGTDASIGSVHVFGTPEYEMVQRRFVASLAPGRHRLKVVIYGTEAFSYVRHSATYNIFKE